MDKLENTLENYNRNIEECKFQLGTQEQFSELNINAVEKMKYIELRKMLINARRLKNKRAYFLKSIDDAIEEGEQALFEAHRKSLCLEESNDVYKYQRNLKLYQSKEEKKE